MLRLDTGHFVLWGDFVEWRLCCFACVLHKGAARGKAAALGWIKWIGGITRNEEPLDFALLVDAWHC